MEWKYSLVTTKAASEARGKGDLFVDQGSASICAQPGMSVQDTGTSQA